MSAQEIKVSTHGNKQNPAILFLHAFPMCSDMWKEQVQFFSEKYFCIAPDLPGYGESALPSSALTFEAYVDSVFNYLKSSKIEKAVWCGLSMGGYLALRMYERDPSFCRSLILCDTKAAADNNEAKLKRWTALQTLQSNRNEFVDTQWKALVGASSQGNSSVETRFHDLLEKTSDAGIAAGLVALATRTDSTQMLSKISVPTLIVVGDEDKVTPVSDAEFLTKSIPGSQLKILKKTGHLSNLENPKIFNETLASFLAPWAR